jgi:hypothetical protein
MIALALQTGVVKKKAMVAYNTGVKSMGMPAFTAER